MAGGCRLRDVSVSPSPSLAPLNAGPAGRSSEGTAMLAASSRKHIARRAGLGRPGAGPWGLALRYLKLNPRSKNSG